MALCGKLAFGETMDWRKRDCVMIIQTLYSFLTKCVPLQRSRVEGADRLQIYFIISLRGQTRCGPEFGGWERG